MPCPFAEAPSGQVDERQPYFIEPITIDVCSMGPDEETFISAACGIFTTGLLADIEKELRIDFEDAYGKSGHYRFEVRWEPEQRDEVGRIELRGYWDFTRIAYQHVSYEAPDHEPDAMFD